MLKARRIRSAVYAVLAGGCLLQFTGCAAAFAPIATGLIENVVLSLLVNLFQQTP